MTAKPALKVVADKDQPADTGLRYSTMSSARPRPGTGPYAVLDVGSTKIACMIGQVDGDGTVRVKAAAHHAAEGIEAGQIVDMEAAAGAIGATVQAAEKLAGLRVEKLFVNINDAYTKAHRVDFTVAVGGKTITREFLQRAYAQSPTLAKLAEYQIIHTLPLHYTLDETAFIQDPLGMVGQQLQVHLLVFTARPEPVLNLRNCIARNYLEVEAMCSSALASALSVLREDERRLGVSVIDMGGGTSSVTTFQRGNPVFAECVPMGGLHVTHDLAAALQTPIAEAERIKTLFGSATPNASLETKQIEVPVLGDTGGLETRLFPQSILSSIIEPRISEILCQVRDCMLKSGYEGVGRYIVLTGGAAQLPGVRDLAQQIFEKPVELRAPEPHKGMTQPNSGPAFATTGGLLRFAMTQEFRKDSVSLDVSPANPTLMSRLKGWMKDNL
ncbi:MAG: cell division protein FtsA [Alphaproteobacteria bacterium]